MAWAGEPSWKLRRGPSNAPAYGDALHHGLQLSSQAGAPGPINNVLMVAVRGDGGSSEETCSWEPAA